mmetsp:Transcript_22637/g.34825  ORF Transcript_22637/g.34825 Transcript_22637/m.34825 type:complete len:202 (+) Transcript_22637:1058-1663(+)
MSSSIALLLFVLARRTAMSASSMSSSFDAPLGSKQSRTVPANSTGSCGIIAIPFCRPRTSASPSVERSIPSSNILPPSISTRRNSAAVNEVLPAPVRPTTPHRLPDCIVKHKPSSANGRPSRYLKETSRNSNTPRLGQSCSNTTSSGVSRALSCGNVVMAFMRSTDVIAASASLVFSIKKLSVMVKFDAHIINRATIPASI